MVFVSIVQVLNAFTLILSTIIETIAPHLQLLRWVALQEIAMGKEAVDFMLLVMVIVPSVTNAMVQALLAFPIEMGKMMVAANVEFVMAQVLAVMRRNTRIIRMNALLLMVLVTQVIVMGRAIAEFMLLAKRVIAQCAKRQTGMAVADILVVAKEILSVLANAQLLTIGVMAKAIAQHRQDVLILSGGIVAPMYTMTRI